MSVLGLSKAICVVALQSCSVVALHSCLCCGSPELSVLRLSRAVCVAALHSCLC